MKAYALMKGKKTLAVSLNKAELWRMALEANSKESYYGINWRCDPAEKKKLEEAGWNVKAIDFKVMS